MTFFKVIKDNQIIDAGSTFLKWNVKWQQLFACDAEDGQFVLSLKEIVYHDDWMRRCVFEISNVEEARVVCIEQKEYEEIRELLSDNEIIDIPVEEYPIEVEPEPVQPEKQKTVNEMRTLLKEQQQQIDLLTGCILELSELIGTGV